MTEEDDLMDRLDLTIEEAEKNMRRCSNHILLLLYDCRSELEVNRRHINGLLDRLIRLAGGDEL